MPAPSRLPTFLFFASLFCATFEKVHWQVGLTIRLADLLAFLFVVSFAVDAIRSADRRVPRTVGVLGLFLAAFLVVYLIGFYNLQTRDALSQFGKGIVTWAIHFLFLVCGVVFLARQTERFFWRALAWFFAGTAANAAYGFLQLGAASAGFDLDKAVLSPITGGAASINIYGAVRGTNVLRANALTGDPNHLGIVLILPLLVLTPIYLRLEQGHRLRVKLGALLGFLLVMEIATLSRSGLLGLTVGALVLAVPYRRLIPTKRLLYPLAGVAVALLAVAATRLHFVATVLRSRTHTSSAGASVHFGVYDFIPQVLHAHPLFGLGFNTFSVYYEFVTGKTDWGPHSFYVALLVETGLVGTIVFGGFLWYLFVRLAAARRIGRALAAQGDAAAARVRPLAWGLTAALVGTLAANAFYLTMTFAYFYAFALFVIATPIVFWAPSTLIWMAALQAVMWASFGLIVWTHLAYPLAAAAGARLRRYRPRRDDGYVPSVVLVIAAHDEAAVIERRLQNVLALDYPADRLQIVVSSDGSSDGTNELVERTAGVRLLANPRVGKTAAQDAAVRATESDVVAFSDANSTWQPDALRMLVRNLADPEVGYVCGRLRLADPVSGENVEGVYWRYELWLRAQESGLGSITAGNGAIYAVRRSAYPELGSRYSHDIGLPYRFRRLGLRSVYEPEAIAVEPPAASTGAEWGRKVRMLSRSWFDTVRGGMLSPRRLGPVYYAELLSHRLLRYASGLLHVALLASSVALAPDSLAARVLLAGQVLWLALAAVGWRWPGRVPFSGLAWYYLVVTAASLAALGRVLRTGPQMTWSPAEGTR